MDKPRRPVPRITPLRVPQTVEQRRKELFEQMLKEALEG